MLRETPGCLPYSHTTHRHYYPSPPLSFKGTFELAKWKGVAEQYHGPMRVLAFGDHLESLSREENPTCEAPWHEGGPGRV